MDFHLDPFLHPEEEEGKRRGRDASMGRYVFAPLPKGQMNMESEGQFKREREVVRKLLYYRVTMVVLYYLLKVAF